MVDRCKEYTFQIRIQAEAQVEVPCLLLLASALLPSAQRYVDYS
jgi:hypothetical protein